MPHKLDYSFNPVALPMKKIVGYLLPLIAIFAIGSAMEWYDARPVLGEPTRATLQAEFTAVPIPPADIAVDEPTVLSRGSAIRMVGHFRTAQTASAVIAYYEDKLSGLGWQPVDVTKRHNAEPAIRYCKGDRSVTINAAPGIDATTYYVGLAWAKRRESSDRCPGSDMGVAAK